MLSYLLIMVISFGSVQQTVTTIQQQMPDEQTCTAIEQNTNQQIISDGGTVVSESCYSIPGGGTH